ncbi:N-acetyl-gamma-glutamyl-phosphate reductase [Nocardia sp. NPDC004340]
MTTVAVLGASGFIGGEILRLLGGHPKVATVVPVSSSKVGQAVGEVVRGLRNSPLGDLRFSSIDEVRSIDIAISAMPNGILPQVLPQLRQQAGHVVNVAGDFRLSDPEQLARHYPKSSAAGVPDAYFVPEFADAAPASVVNLPGCMAVAAQYAVMPLFRAGLVDGPMVIEAKTGSSGGGLAGEPHAQRYGEVRMHRFFGHRHEPEIAEAIGRYAGVTPDIRFSTMSLPISRGIFVTSYARLAPGADVAQVRRAYAHSYRGQTFVRVRNGRTPTSFPSLNTVVGTNYAEVGVAVRDRDCIAVCALDNLIKGGAGQAVQTMNRLLGFEEHAGLEAVARWP